MLQPGIPSLEPGVEWVCIDAVDPIGLAGRWQGLVGGAVEVDEDGDVSLRTGTVQLLFLGVPEAKGAKNRLHFDLRANDFESAVGTALELGASRADDIYRGDRWQVLRDPEGNEFCILQPRPTAS